MMTKRATQNAVAVSTRRTARTALAIVAVVVGAAACKAQEPAPTPAAAATDSTILARRDDCPNDGLWRPCVLLERLKRSGYDSRMVETDTTRVPFLSPPGLHYQIGRSGLLVVFYFPDVESARKSWMALDTLALTPPGYTPRATVGDTTGDTASVWPGRPLPIRSGNMIAAFFGTTAAQIERVGLALRAGLPQPPKPE